MWHYRTEANFTIPSECEAVTVTIERPRSESLLFMLMDGGLLVRGKGTYELSTNVRSTRRVSLKAITESIDQSPMQRAVLELVEGQGTMFGASCLVLGDPCHISHGDALIRLQVDNLDREECCVELEFWVKPI